MKEQRLFLALVLSLLLIPVIGVHAQQTAAINADEAKTVAPTKEEKTLEASGISATVTVLKSDTPYPAGGSAFAQIELKNTTKSRFLDATLELETDKAKIRSVYGKSIEAGDGETNRTATVTKIARGKPRQVIVEVGLQEDTEISPDTRGANTLRITLNKAGTKSETAVFNWNVMSCGDRFYNEIVKVRDGSGSGIADALETARKRNKARPGRWLFQPNSRYARAKRTCVSRARRWSSRHGRYVYVCTRYRATAPATASAGTAAPYEHERQVYNFASRFVRARARDSELQQTRDSGWATTRVSQNLQGFLKQQSHPAICTGIIPFFDYFDERMAGFVKRAEKFRDMAGKGFVLAQMRTSEALKYSESEESKEEGHPGWGSAPLDIPGPGGLADLKQRLVQLAEWTGDTELPDKLKETDNSFSALSVMSEFVKSDAGKDLAKEKRAILLRALSAIEAADYIGTVASHYENLHTALIGSMSDLRQAHSRTCNCGG